jgi:subtilase family serine protease
VKFQTGWGNNAVRIADGVANATEGSAGQNPPLDPPDVSLGFIGGSGGGTSRVYAKPSYQKKLAGTQRLQPDISMVADPFTGAEVVERSLDDKGNPQPGNLGMEVIGGTSLACPLFTGIWAIANQAHGSSLGQAAPRLYKLPASAITDITPVTSPTNITGTLTDAKGANQMISLQLAMPETAAPFYSAMYNSPNSPYRWMVLSFGTDSSLQTAVGWDNVTGLGVPNGMKFVQALK